MQCCLPNGTVEYEMVCSVVSVVWCSEVTAGYSEYRMWGAVHYLVRYSGVCAVVLLGVLCGEVQCGVWCTLVWCVV